MYYTFNKCSNIKIIGKHPQCLPKPLDAGKEWFEGENSMRNLDNYSYPSNPNLSFELDNRAKLTDFINASAISASGILMNEKSKSVFEKFDLGESKFYDASVLYNNENHKYYWLHFVTFNFNNINFNKSKFIVTNLAFKKLRNIDIKNEQDFYLKKESLGFLRGIKAKKIYLKKETYRDVHYFTKIGKANVFISGQLIDEVKVNKLIGYDLQEQSVLI